MKMLFSSAITINIIINAAALYNLFAILSLSFAVLSLSFAILSFQDCRTADKTT